MTNHRMPVRLNDRALLLEACAAADVEVLGDRAWEINGTVVHGLGLRPEGWTDTIVVDALGLVHVPSLRDPWDARLHLLVSGYIRLVGEMHRAAVRWSPDLAAMLPLYGVGAPAPADLPPAPTPLRADESAALVARVRAAGASVQRPTTPTISTRLLDVLRRAARAIRRTVLQ